VLAGIAGSLLGAGTNYALAVVWGRPLVERIGGYFFVKPEQFAAAERYFRRHGEITTLVGRLIPVIRQLISVPAGLARMPLSRFTAYTALGSGLWSAVLIWIGYIAGNNEDVWEPLLRDATVYVVGAACALIAVYIFIHRRITARF
jgi:membrane protein DedA with SNARE-associated domain